MRDDREADDKGFKVTDRRHFTTEGGVREESSQAPAEETGRPDEAPRSHPTAPLAEIDFSTFVLSLTTSALYHLGEMPRPDTGATEKNLPLAKQSIDIISMLRDKTTGNLTEDESQLIENLLYDLRMKYVAATK
jgi:hypothetical protein